MLSEELTILFLAISNGSVTAETLGELGNSNGQYFVGLMYYFGYGVPVDYKKAANWIKLSNENGSKKAKSFWEEKELYKY